MLTAFAIRGVAGALIEAVLGLVLAELAYRLMELDRDRPAPARYEGRVLTGAKTTAPMKNRGTSAKATARRPARRRPARRLPVDHKTLTTGRRAAWRTKALALAAPSSCGARARQP